MAKEEMSQCFPVLYLKVWLTILREAEGGVREAVLGVRCGQDEKPHGSWVNKPMTNSGEKLC